MDLIEFHAELKKLEESIKAQGLNADVRGHVHWCGEEMSIEVTASEPYDDKGFWRSEREFPGSPGKSDEILAEARQWVLALPNAEDRAAELIIQKLNKLAGELPKGGSDIARAAWAEVHKMLVAKAGHLAKNGLPSPARIQQINA